MNYLNNSFYILCNKQHQLNLDYALSHYPNLNSNFKGVDHYISQTQLTYHRCLEKITAQRNPLNLQDLSLCFKKTPYNYEVVIHHVDDNTCLLMSQILKNSIALFKRELEHMPPEDDSRFLKSITQMQETLNYALNQNVSAAQRCFSVSTTIMLSLGLHILIKSLNHLTKKIKTKEIELQILQDTLTLSSKVVQQDNEKQLQQKINNLKTLNTNEENFTILLKQATRRQIKTNAIRIIQEHFTNKSLKFKNRDHSNTLTDSSESDYSDADPIS